MHSRIMGTESKLFAVVRYGNENEGPDGNDTVYLVPAETPEAAAEIADNILELASSRKVSPRSQLVILLSSGGHMIDSKDEPYMGPLFGIAAYYQGLRSWHRDADSSIWEEDAFA